MTRKRTKQTRIKRRGLKRNETGDISTLPLKPRTITILKDAGIKTIDTLNQLDRTQLSKIKYLGRTGISEINNVLKSIDSLLLSPGTLSVLKQAEINNVAQLFALSGDLTNLENLTDSAIREINLAILPLDELPLATRAINILKESGIVFTGQLMRLNFDEIWDIKKIGAISFKDIKALIIKEREQLQDVDYGPTNFVRENKTSQLLSYEYYSDGAVIDTAPISREAFLEDLLSSLQPREYSIIMRRYGLIGGIGDTLADIGTDFGITRERIRQIQNKSVKKLSKLLISPKYKNIINLIDDFISERDHVVTDEEIDKAAYSLFNIDKFDGSSILDLLTDSGLYRRHSMKSFCFYTIKKDKLDTRLINEGIITILEKENKPLPLSFILDYLLSKKIIRATAEHSQAVVNKICGVNPQIEKVGNFYIRSRYATQRNVALIRGVLETEDAPMHFTEITNRINDMLPENDSIDVRRVHMILIESDCFSHTGRRGTYALSSWGFRKETTPELCKEFINNAGFPVHWLQIYNFVAKYKNSSKIAIRAILDSSGHFIHLGNGIYDIKK